MLPFLEPKKAVSVIIARHDKPGLEVNPEMEAPESEINPALKACAEDLLRAIDDRSIIDIAKALECACEICSMMPQENEEEEEGEE
jgi:hypothetical protein